MAVTKRTRYEVLRRDWHACRYCGATAPEVKLTVDHVVPVALGGSDDPSNLVACCGPCNSGKTSTTPDAPLVAQVSEDAIRWTLAVRAAAEKASTNVAAANAYAEKFQEEWERWTYGWKENEYPLPSHWRTKVESYFEDGLPIAVLIRCVRIAMDGPAGPDKKFNYMGGVAKNHLIKIQEEARASLKGRPAKLASVTAISPSPNHPPLVECKEGPDCLSGSAVMHPDCTDPVCDACHGRAHAYSDGYDDGEASVYDRFKNELHELAVSPDEELARRVKEFQRAGLRVLYWLRAQDHERGDGITHYFGKPLHDLIVPGIDGGPATLDDCKHCMSCQCNARGDTGDDGKPYECENPAWADPAYLKDAPGCEFCGDPLCRYIDGTYAGSMDGAQRTYAIVDRLHMTALMSDKAMRLVVDGPPRRRTADSEPF